jgi:hypothetical protein
MDRTVVYQRDSRVARLPGTAVELGEDDAAADAGRIFDLNVIAGRVVSKSNSESWPSVCTENLNPDVVMVKPAEDRV